MGRIAPITTFVNEENGNIYGVFLYIFMVSLLTNPEHCYKMRKQMRGTGGSVFFPLQRVCGR